MSSLPPVAGEHCGVVVVNWNGGERNLDCLGSLVAAGLAQERVVFVDNASNDASVERVRAAFPGVEILQNDANLGFCAGTNRGIERALERGDEAVLLLNNDVVVRPGFLEPLLSALEEPDVGAAGPKMLADREGRVIWCAGAFVRHRENVTKLRGLGESDDGRYDVEEDVDYIPACALVVARRALEKVGMLDPQFFAYMEDVDFGVRLREGGFRIRYLPQSRVVHFAGSASGGGYAPARKYANALNSVRFLRKHPSLRGWFGLALWDVGSLPFVWVRELVRGGNPRAVWYKARGLWAGLRGAQVTAATFEHFRSSEGRA